MRILLLAVILGASAFSLAACDAVDGAAGEARMTVRLTDAPFPFDLADSANVTITRIELIAGGDEAVGDTTASDSTEADDRDRMLLFDAAVDGGPMAFNLLDLRDGVTATLVSEIAVPADGRYNEIRVFVGDDASVVFTDGRTFPLKLPSAQQSGLKIRLPDYDTASEGEAIDLLLDFDVEKSFVVRGNMEAGSFNGFLFKPVIEVESFEVGAEDSETGTEG